MSSQFTPHQINKHLLINYATQPNPTQHHSKNQQTNSSSIILPRQQKSPPSVCVTHHLYTILCRLNIRPPVILGQQRLHLIRLQLARIIDIHHREPIRAPSSKRKNREKINQIRKRDPCKWPCGYGGIRRAHTRPLKVKRTSAIVPRLFLLVREGQDLSSLLSTNQHHQPAPVPPENLNSPALRDFRRPLPVPGFGSDRTAR